MKAEVLALLMRLQESKELGAVTCIVKGDLVVLDGEAGRLTVRGTSCISSIRLESWHVPCRSLSIMCLGSRILRPTVS